MTKFEQAIEKFNQAIKDFDPKIKKHAEAVRDHVIKIHDYEPENRKYAERILNLTYKLLTSKPGEKRKKYLKEYHEEAQKAQGHPSVLFKALGLAMITLGLCIAAIGFLCPIPGIGMAIGMATVLAGFGVFNHGNTPTELSYEMHELKENIKQNVIL